MLATFRGSKENNILTPDANILVNTPGDPNPGRRYKALAFGGARPEKRWEWGGNYGALFSPDAVQWAAYEDNPVLVDASEVNPSVFFIAASGRYVCFPKQRMKVAKWVRRCVAQAFSKDFIQWTFAPIILAPNAAEKEGVLTTRLVRFKGRELVTNAAAFGSVRVEICDTQGRPWKGFTRDQCDAFRGDAIRHTVSWAGRTDVAELWGKPVQLRFYLQNASLYSFTFQSP